MKQTMMLQHFLFISVLLILRPNAVGSLNKYTGISWHASHQPLNKRYLLFPRTQQVHRQF